MEAHAVTREQVQSYYRAGAIALRALQDRGFGAARFGEGGAASWRLFKGDLGDSHRLDLLLRDAAVNYPLAFAPREIFGLPGLADDEPFGPSWRSLPPSQSGPILREAEHQTAAGAEKSVGEVLTGLAEVWGLAPAQVDPASLEAIVPASRIAVAGLGAIVALADHLAEREGMDLGDQILVVTDEPSIRQLAGMAAALTGSRKTPVCVGVSASAEDVTAAGFARVTAHVISPDAPDEARAAAQRLAAELGA